MSSNAINKNDPTPRYLQVRRILEEGVRTGQYRPGGRLPGERELALELQVSQMTANKAIQALVSDGWLRREAGRGTFVSEDFCIPVPDVLRVGFAFPVSADIIEEDFYLSSLLRGIQRAVINEPVSLTLLETPVHLLYERIVQIPIDGCLLTEVPESCLSDVQRLTNEGKKIVMMSTDRALPTVPTVDSDNYGGTRAAMEHLIGLGHRRIAGIFSYTNSCNTRHRLRSYQETLRLHDIDIPSEYIINFNEENPSESEHYALLTQLLTATSHPPTALFCGGFLIALEAIKAVASLGMRVPEDISIVGFDDPVAADYLTPPLTTVHQPLEEMGYRAMTKLVGWLRTHDSPSIQEVLPATLRLRNSTAPFPNPGK